MAARAQRKAPTYFTLKSCSRSSSTTVSMGPVADAEPPGGEPLLTRICRPPSRSAAWATARSICSLLVTSATSGTTRRPVPASSSRAVLSSCSFERDDRHVHALSGQLLGDRSADPQAAPGHERPLALQSEVHSLASLSVC